MFEVFESKKKKIKDHFESTKDILSITYDRILEVLENTEEKFDFSLSLKP